MRQLRPNLGVLTAATLVVGVALAAHLITRSDGAADNEPQPRIGVPTFTPSTAEGSPTTLAEAERKVKHELLVPNVPEANEENLLGIEVQGATDVEMSFPPPTDSTSDLYQDHLSVWELPWQGGDPVAQFKEDIERAPAVGKELCAVNDAPALCVMARSPSSKGAPNPAFVKFVSGDLEIQLLGGDDLEVLLGIAASIQEQGR